MKLLRFLLAFGAASAAASGQTATFVVVLDHSTASPGTMVNGAVRCSWAATGGIGYAGGAFRLRMDGLGVADVLIPNNGSGGINSETNNQRVGVPAAEVPPGGYTVSDQWTSGRRPKRAYFPPEGEGLAGGGFRFPPNGAGPTDMHFSVEQHAGATYLTGRNGAGIENGIEQAQFARGLQADPLFFEGQPSFDLFKFSFVYRGGVAFILPEIFSAAIFTSDAGANVPAQTMTIGAIVTPAPGSAFPLIAVALLAIGRRRSRRI